MTRALSSAAEAFLREPHLCTLTTIRPDGSPHAVPVRFTWDDSSGLARIMSVITRQKTRNLLLRPGSRAAACQVVGYRWITLEGVAAVSDDPQRVREGARRYTMRYRAPPPDPPGLIVIEIAVDRVLGIY